jgi:uncharacterized protein
VRPIIVSLPIADRQASFRFYGEGLGFEVIGDHEVAAPGHSECVMSLEADVDETIERARRAGARIVSEPQQQPWGYVGTFADPDGHLWMVSGD